MTLYCCPVVRQTLCIGHTGNGRSKQTGNLRELTHIRQPMLVNCLRRRLLWYPRHPFSAGLSVAAYSSLLLFIASVLLGVSFMAPNNSKKVAHSQISHGLQMSNQLQIHHHKQQLPAAATYPSSTTRHHSARGHWTKVPGFSACQLWQPCHSSSHQLFLNSFSLRLLSWMAKVPVVMPNRVLFHSLVLS